MESRFKDALGAAKGEATLLMLFIPSVDRYGEEVVEQEQWVDKALETLGKCFGGATAYPKAKGVWRDDERAGELVFDEPFIIQCYTSEDAIDEHTETLLEFLTEMGAVAIVIDKEFLEISFPLEEKSNGE